MDITNFDWILDEDRIVQNFSEFSFSGVLKNLSPNVNSLKEKDDCYLLVLDLPVRTKQRDIKLTYKRKNLIILIKDRTLSIKKMAFFYTSPYLFFREVFVPQKCSARLITFSISDSILLLKIPKNQSLSIMGLIKLYGQWIRWQFEKISLFAK